MTKETRRRKKKRKTLPVIIGVIFAIGIIGSFGQTDEDDNKSSANIETFNKEEGNIIDSEKGIATDQEEDTKKENSDTSELNQSIVSTPEPTPEENPFEIIDLFVELYNSTAATPITNISVMDLQGDDYRTEFRLMAFDNAIGQKGTISDSRIDIVNYGTWSNDSIRIYVTAPSYDMALEIYTNTVHIWDNSIDDEELLREFDNASIYLGNGGYISGLLSKSYSNGGISGYELMLDCTNIKFMDK